jgi:hypothetical protein
MEPDLGCRVTQASDSRVSLAVERSLAPIELIFCGVQLVLQDFRELVRG